jgi:cbb3-type cytochrome oxidase cytochrome c subunit
MSALSLHKRIEENTGLLIFGILLVSSIGGLVQILAGAQPREPAGAPSANTQPLYGGWSLTRPRYLHPRRL